MRTYLVWANLALFLATEAAAQTSDPPFCAYITPDSAVFMILVPNAVWPRAAAIRHDQQSPRRMFWGSGFQWEVLWDDRTESSPLGYCCGLAFQIPAAALPAPTQEAVRPEAGKATHIQVNGLQQLVVTAIEPQVSARWAGDTLVLRLRPSAPLNELLAWHPDSIQLQAFPWAADTAYHGWAHPSYLKQRANGLTTACS
jgi:hypothetical protein